MKSDLIVSTLQNTINYSSKILQATQAEYVEPLQEGVQNVSENLEVAVAHFDKKLFRVLNVFEHYQWIEIVAIMGLIVSPFIVLFVWICGVRACFLLWNHYKNGTEPEMRKMRLRFCSLWLGFAFLGSLLLLAGFLGLISAQAAGEGCIVSLNDFLTLNMYFSFPFIVEHTDGVTYGNISRECFTYSGEGDISSALIEDVPVFAVLDNFEQIIETTMTELDEASEKPIAVVQQILSAHANIATYNLITTENSVDLWRRQYILFKEALYGGLQPEDHSMNDAPLSMIQLFDQLHNSTVGIWGNLNFNPTVNSPTIFDNEVLSWTQDRTIYGIDSQVKRLQSEIISAECDWTVCMTWKSDEHSCCQSQQDPSRCISMDSDHNIFLNPASDFDFFDGTGTIDDERNHPSLNALLLCLVEATRLGLFSWEHIYMWVASFYLTNCRMRVIESTNDKLFQKCTGAASPSSATYDEYMRSIQISWNQISKSMSNIENSFEYATEQTDVMMEDMNNTVEQLDNDLSCRGLFDELSTAAEFTCWNLCHDLAMTALWWCLLAACSLVGTILSWRLFHYFADRCSFDDDAIGPLGDYRRTSFLFRMVKEGENEEVEKCCLYQDPQTAFDEHMNGWLHIAAYYGNTGACQIFLSHGCDPNFQNKFGDTPVNTAAKGGQFSDNNVDVEQQNDETKLQSLSESHQDVVHFLTEYCSRDYHSSSETIQKL